MQINKKIKSKPTTIQCNQNHLKSKFRIKIRTFINFHKIRFKKNRLKHRCQNSIYSFKINLNQKRKKTMQFMDVSILYIYMVHRDLCSAHSTTLTDVAAVSLNCFSQCALQQHYFHDLTFFKKPKKKNRNTHVCLCRCLMRV